MIEWWNNMPLVQQIFATLAIPATLILIIQTILLLFGLGDSDGGDGALDGSAQDGDGLAGDTDSSSDIGLRVLTVRGLVAFFAVGGWVGVALIDVGTHPAMASLGALIAGFGALVLVAWIVKLLLGLQSSGNISIDNAVGLVGDVYLRIPGGMRGSGKINIVLQGRLIEIDALTEDPDGIETGSQARVVRRRGDRLIVRRIP